MRPPFLFLLGTREKETRRARCKEKEKRWCSPGQNRASIPRCPTQSDRTAGLVQDGHRQAPPTAAAHAGQRRNAARFSTAPWSVSGNRKILSLLHQMRRNSTEQKLCHRLPVVPGLQ